MKKYGKKTWQKRNRVMAWMLLVTLLLVSVIGCTKTEDAASSEQGLLEEVVDILSLVKRLDKGTVVPLAEGPVVAEDMTAEAVTVLADFSSRFAAQSLTAARDAGQENPVWSPVSAYLALMGVAMGTWGQSLAEFEQVLGLEAEQWPQWSQSLMTYLNWMQEDAKVRAANSVWADEDTELTKEYREKMSEYLYADVYQGDLSGEKVMKAINKWADEKTGGMIPQLRTEPYGPHVTVAILNAVYLEQQWEEPFSVYRTGEEIFYTADDQEVSARFLRDWSVRRDYVKTDRYDGILLPYDAGDLAFVALRPAAGQSLEELMASLTAADWKQIPAIAADTLMNFSMPKIELEYQQSLTDVMKELGLLTIMTEPGEDLTPMGLTKGGGSLGFFGVSQTVKIQVEEEGTKAAAVTDATAADAGPVEDDAVLELHFDHPYIYAILDQSTGLPLFIGVMDCPPGA